MQAQYLFETILPDIEERNPELERGKIGVLYPAAFMGNAVADAAHAAGLGHPRTDGNAIYPRTSKLMRWLEQCAAWCCGGWQSAEPRWTKIASAGERLFSESLYPTEAERTLSAHCSHFSGSLM